MEKKQDIGFIKNLLNNLPLLRWVKKFSADNTLDDNSLAEKFGVKCNEQSISVGDKSMTKLFVSQARYNGEEFVRYNIAQIKETLDLLGADGELIISKSNTKELFIQVKDSVVVVSPLPKSDK